jgi:UDP-N-acetyl-D-glucosamine dehydrogenase
MHPIMERLAETLSGARPTVAIVGLGYVGLPLAMAMAESGARVIGIDVEPTRCARLNEGSSHVDDVDDATLWRALAGDRGSFRATTEYAVIAAADAILVCVPTPLRQTKDPDTSYIAAAVASIEPHVREGQLLVLESTTYPGTTLEILAPMLAARGLEPGRNVALAFSPERVDPGNREYGLANTPKVVGGVTAACSKAARAVYERVCEQVVLVSSPTTAEMVKLLENTFRMVNIALANEFALICNELDLDVWEVIEAAATKPFGFMPFWPGPGLGGHCVPVDPHHLAWKLRAHHFTARFVELADAINSRMPEYVVGVVSDALNERERSVKGSDIVVLGVAYKPDVTDYRESPALDVIRRLESKGARVRYNDPLVPVMELDGEERRSVQLTDELLGDAHCVLIVTHHSVFDYARIVELSSLVVDSRNATRTVLRRQTDRRAHVVRI